MKTYDLVAVANQNTAFYVMGADVEISRDKHGSYVVINGKKIRGLSYVEYICKVKVVTEKEEKKLKALKILKEKRVSLDWIKGCNSYVQYKMACEYWYEITQEDFNLVREVLLWY